MLGPQYMVRLVLRGRRANALAELLDAACRGLLVERHGGVREHVRHPADQLLALVPGLVTGDLDGRLHPTTVSPAGAVRTRKPPLPERERRSRMMRDFSTYRAHHQIEPVLLDTSHCRLRRPPRTSAVLHHPRP